MVEVIGRMMLALGVVLAIMWLLAKWARKPLGRKSDKVINVLARQQLSRAASIAVVKIADRALVIGVTEQSVQLLTETDLALIEAALPADEVDEEAQPLQLSAVDDGSSEAERLEAAFALDSAAAGGAPRAIRSHGAPVTSGRATTSRGRNAPKRGARSASSSALDGSILSPKVWKQLMQGARDLTVRR